MSAPAEALVPGARYAVPPAGIVSTGWPRVRQTCNNIGWRFDPWQDAVGRLILARATGGKWAADLSILSIPRQVGKSYLLGCIIFALCLLQPKLRVIWTSHHTATTEEMYESMKELAQHKRVAPHIAKCIALQGSRWRIIFRNGSRIDFGARERGFGRGKAKVGVLVLDEFQHISMRALSNLTPTTNTAENPLILCAGTPPSPHDNGEAFTMRRKSAIAGISSDTFYVEFSADPDADLDDRKQWAKANPSFPKRTPERAFLLNRKVLDDESFRREFMGVHDEANTGGIMPKWDDRGNVKVERPASLVVGLAGDVDGEWGSIGSAGMDDDGRLIVGAVKRQPGQGWLVAEAKRIQDEHGYLVAIDEKGPLSDLLVDLDTAGVRYVGLSLTQYVDACQSLWRQVEDDQLRHPKHPELDAAVRRAKWRKVGDRKAFGRQTGDISMLEAVTVAASQVLAAYDVLDSIL